MRKLMIAAAAAMLAAPVVSAGQEWEWKEIGRGVECVEARIEMGGAVQSVAAVRYRAGRYTTEVVNDPAERADSTSALAVRYGGLGAVNGSYFNMREMTPVTYVKDDGVVECEIAPEEEYLTDGLLVVFGHKVKIVSWLPEQYAAGKMAAKKNERKSGRALSRSREALASGPLLVSGGKPAREEWPADAFVQARHPRSIIGTSKGGWVYYIVIDGRAPGLADGASIPEAAEIALMFGLDSALNLDGGGSSTLWTESSGVISHPCDNRSFDHAGQRIVPNAVIFY